VSPWRVSSWRASFSDTRSRSSVSSASSDWPGHSRSARCTCAGDEPRAPRSRPRSRPQRCAPTAPKRSKPPPTNAATAAGGSRRPQPRRTALAAPIQPRLTRSRIRINPPRGRATPRGPNRPNRNRSTSHSVVPQRPFRRPTQPHRPRNIAAGPISPSHQLLRQPQRERHPREIPPDTDRHQELSPHRRHPRPPTEGSSSCRQSAMSAGCGWGCAVFPSKACRRTASPVALSTRGGSW
jgi:hypothetical protein